MNGHIEAPVEELPIDKAKDVSKNPYQKGLSHQQMQHVYGQWAPDYEKAMCPKYYRGPLFTAEGLADLVSSEQRSSFNVLDIGAGTGLVGLQLKQLGFHNIDALEPSQSMVIEAVKKNVYKKFYISAIGDEPVSIRDNAYDGIVTCGSFGENHIPSDALVDMIRIVRQGGIIIIAMRHRYLVEAKELIDKFEPLAENLECAGSWKLLKKEIKSQYAFEYDGVVYTYQVQKYAESS